MAGIYDSRFRITGLSSGLDIDSIVSQLMDIERKPITQLEINKTTVTTKLTAWRELNTRIQAFSIKNNALLKESTYQGRTATSSNSEILTATASAGISTSSQKITVKSLATSHQIASQSYTGGSDVVGTGTFTISIGSSRFETITLDEEHNTLTDLKNAINNSNHGVTASIVQQGTNDYRLVLTAKSMGSEAIISIENNLSGGLTPTFSTIQEASDAHITVGSGASALDIYRQTNIITDVLPGIYLTLKSADETKPVTVSLQNNSSSTRSTIEGFIEQFNNLVTYFENQFFYDADSGETGALFSNTSLMNIKADLYSKVTDSIKGMGKYSNLGELGIGIDNTGRLIIQDDTLLNNALQNNMENVMDFFTNKDYGLAVRVKNYLDNITDETNGILCTTEETYTTEIEYLDKKIAEKEEYMTRLQSMYYTKFAAFEAAMATLKSQSDYISQQLLAMHNNPYSNDQ